MPVFDMTKDRFLDPKKADVFSFGRAPSTIDILTNPKGVEFTSCDDRAAWTTHEDLRLRLISQADLLVEKKATGRLRDLDDIDKLTQKD